MTEIEKLRSKMKEMENEFKEIENGIKIIRTQMDTMQETIKNLELELAERSKNIHLTLTEPKQKP